MYCYIHSPPNQTIDKFKMLSAEHEARLKAEASADNHLQRLAVHSQQVSEYAVQKATDFDEICKQVSVRCHAFQMLVPGPGSAGRPVQEDVLMSWAGPAFRILAVIAVRVR